MASVPSAGRPPAVQTRPPYTAPTTGQGVETTATRPQLSQKSRPAAAPHRRTARLAAAAPPGPVRVSRETKGRGGKTVTLVRGLALEEAALAKLAQQLKAACGSGGTVKDGVIEVQGEHRDRIVELLQAQGHEVKRAGG